MDFEKIIDADQKQKEDLEKRVNEMEKPEECADIIEVEDDASKKDSEEELKPIINSDDYEKTPFEKKEFGSNKGDIAV